MPRNRERKKLVYAPLSEISNPHHKEQRFAERKCMDDVRRKTKGFMRSDFMYVYIYMCIPEACKLKSITFIGFYQISQWISTGKKREERNALVTTYIKHDFSKLFNPPSHTTGFFLHSPQWKLFLPSFRSHYVQRWRLPRVALFSRMNERSS